MASRRKCGVVSRKAHSSCPPGTIDYSNWSTVYDSSLFLAVACSCSKVESFQVDKEH